MSPLSINSYACILTLVYSHTHIFT